MIFSDFSVKHPVIISILLAILLVFGLIALSALNYEMIPTVGLPSAVIVTTYPGASASDVEKDITRIIENQMSTLPGIQNMNSTSSNSFSTVSLEFKKDVNVRDKLPQIRELLNGIRGQLPDGIQGEPVIYIVESSAFLPVFSVRIDSSMNKEDLTKYLEDNVSPALARIDGVSKINIVGGNKREAVVNVNTWELESRKLSVLQIYEALRYNNLNVPAGSASFRGKSIAFTASGTFKSLEELKNLPVGYSGSTLIYLKDIADIEIKEQKPGIIIRESGKDYVMIDILKRDEGNTIFIAEEAKKIFNAMTKNTYGAVQYKIVSDQSETTKTSLKTVLETGITGLILTIFVILLVLHDWRATIIISLSIPLSILFAVLGLYATGRSINLLTLSGMVVAIGMIVDNSIVILENTFNKFSQTHNKKEAARSGASEMGAAVLASTLTSICVFAPLLFLRGIIGIILNDLSLTIVYALAASALVAVVVVPWLSSLILKKEDAVKKPAWLLFVQNKIDAAINAMTNGYRKLLTLALENKLYVIALAGVLFVSGILLVTSLKVNFLPPSDTGEFEIRIAAPAGYSLAETVKKVDEINMLVNELVPEIETAVYYVGSSSVIAISSVPNKAIARIRLVPNNMRKRSVQEIIPIVQKSVMQKITNCDVTVLNGGFDALLALGTGGQGFKIEIYGPKLADVVETANKTLELMNMDPDVFKAELSARTDAEELYIDLSQTYMGSLGVTPYEAGITSRILFNGMEAGKLRLDDGDYPIRITSDLVDKPINEDVLNRLAIVTRDKRFITFSAFSEMKLRPTLSVIERRNRNFSIEVIGYLKTDDQSGVMNRVIGKLKTMELPGGVKFSTAGTTALIADSITSLSIVLAISVFLVYCVMVIQFERYLQPLIIMSSIPLCLVGVVLGLLLWNSSMSIIAMLALITLGGTVVNNAIVLVDYANLLRTKSDKPLREIILDACANRLKPILMTATTTLLGVLPMALAHGNGSEVYAPLGQAIFGGLFSSTLITLLLVPVLYETLEHGKVRVEGLMKKLGTAANYNEENVE